jgi:hypothetical protein
VSCSLRLEIVQTARAKAYDKGVGSVSIFERLIRSTLDRVISLAMMVYSSNRRLVRFCLAEVALLDTIVIDRLVPDMLLLHLMNTLDRIFRPRTINTLLEEMEILVSPKVRSSLIEVADQCTLDAVASSRKMSAILAFVGKYIPDSFIPPESAKGWSNLKLKLHVPTLISRNPDSLIGQN